MKMTNWNERKGREARVGYGSMARGEPREGSVAERMESKATATARQRPCGGYDATVRIPADAPTICNPPEVETFYAQDWTAVVLGVTNRALAYAVRGGISIREA